MAPKKKIVHIINTLERGGAEMSLLRMLPLLSGIESILITLKEKGHLASQFEAKGIRVISIGQKNPWDFASYRRLKKSLQETSPDLVITHLLYPDLIGRFFIQMIVPCKVIASLATTYNFPRYRIARIIERSTKYFSAGYIANAESVKKAYVEKFKVPQEKIAVVPTGIDTETLQNIQPSEDLQKSLGIEIADTVIICVANLHTNKGHRYLLEAFEKLQEKFPQTKLLIVGEGEEKENLLEQAQSFASRKNIFFLGKRSDVPELLALSHIFALPTFFEGMCNAIMEAMARGIPIVTTDIPENRELVTDGKTGILCKLRDSSGFAQALASLVADKTLAQTLGKNASQDIQERYGLNKSIGRWEAYYLSQTKNVYGK